MKKMSLAVSLLLLGMVGMAGSDARAGGNRHPRSPLSSFAASAVLRVADWFDSGFDDSMLPPGADRLHALTGTADGPDIRIDADDSPAAREFLDGFSEHLAPVHPGRGADLRARVSRIDVYAPPSVDIDGAWTRQGLATVRVDAEMVKRPDTRSPSWCVQRRLTRSEGVSPSRAKAISGTRMRALPAIAKLAGEMACSTPDLT